MAGYTVVDPSTVIATHLNQLVAELGRRPVRHGRGAEAARQLKEAAPQLVAGLTPCAAAACDQIAALCRALLSEGVPLKDFRRIAEAMADAARTDGIDPIALVEHIRRRDRRADRADAGAGADAAAGRHARRRAGEPADPGGARSGPNASHPIEPALAGRIVGGDRRGGAAAGRARPSASRSSPRRSRAVRSPGCCARICADAPVLSFLEMPDGKPVEVVAVVGGQLRRRSTQQRRDAGDDRGERTELDRRADHLWLASRQRTVPVAAWCRRTCPLVRKIAWHVHGRVSNAIDIEDLVQIGMVALVEAANGYEDRGHAFATYAGMRGARRDDRSPPSPRQRSARSGMAKRKEIAQARGRNSRAKLGRAVDRGRTRRRRWAWTATSFRELADAAESGASRIARRGLFGSVDVVRRSGGGRRPDSSTATGLRAALADAHRQNCPNARRWCSSSISSRN